MLHDLATGWPKKLAQFLLNTLTLSNINRFSIFFFTVRIWRKSVIELSLKIPPHLKCQVCRYTTLWNDSVLKATIENVVSYRYFLKCVVTEVVLFSIVVFKILTFHKVVYRHTGGVVRSLVIMLLQIFSWFWEWTNFENRLIFDKVKAFKKNRANCCGPPCI